MEPFIEAENLRMNYGDFTAVDDLSFTVFRNEIFGLLGPNGAGKTTTIRMICGLSAPSEGSIRFKSKNGKDPKSMIGYCPQDNIFYPKLTCLEQLVFTGQIYGYSGKRLKNRAMELLDLLGLSDKAASRAASLSGGMQRRLNICLALIHDPEILILDEPEAGLDPQSRILVRDFIKVFGRQKTVILTTHNMDEADRMAHRIAIIDYGKLLMLDTPANLKKAIGEGDMIEMTTEEGNEQLTGKLAEQASALATIINRGPNSILFKHRNIIGLLPEIKKMADDLGLPIGEIKLRENTLEDVFIHLTGRNLRQ